MLTDIGHPAHHTLIIERAKELKLDGGGNLHNVNPRMWADTRKFGDGSKFRFYGLSVFGLNAWGEKFPMPGTDPKQYQPQRATPQVVLNEEQLINKINRLRHELKGAKEQLAALQAKNGSTPTAE